jgi:hypothetical protein
LSRLLRADRNTRSAENSQLPIRKLEIPNEHTAIPLSTIVRAAVKAL